MSFIESLYMKFSFVVVIEYIHDRTLEHVLESSSKLDFSKLMFLYAQFEENALLWLKKHKIIHRNIKSDVILMSEKDMMSSRFIEFFECFFEKSVRNLSNDEQNSWMLNDKNYRIFEMQEKRNYSFSVDMYSLFKIIKRAIEKSFAWHDRNSYLQELVNHDLHVNSSSKITSSNLRIRFEQIIDRLNSTWSSFQIFEVERKFILKFKFIDDEIFALKSSLRIIVIVLWDFELLKFNSFNLKWTYNDFLKWIRSRETAKHCFNCKLNELRNLLLKASIEINVIDEYFYLFFEVNFSVYYHASSFMTNIKSICLMIEINFMSTNEIDMNDQLLIVVDLWQRNYLEYSNFQQFSVKMKRLYDMKIPSIFRKVNNFQLKRKFLEVDRFEHVILAVNQLHSHMMLVKKRDRIIHWMQLIEQSIDRKHSNSNENFVNYLETCRRCYEQKMQSSLTIFEYLCQKQSHLSFVDIKCENHDEVFISILTNQNFETKKTFYKRDKTMQFKFKKKIKFNENFNDFKRRIMNWFASLSHDSKASQNYVVQSSTTHWNQRNSNDLSLSIVHDDNYKFDQHRSQIMSSISIQSNLTYSSMSN